MNRFLLSFFGIVIAFVASAARPAWSVPEYVRTIDKADIIKAAAEATQARYQNSDTVMLDSVAYTRYEADGTYVNYDDTYTKILTEAGRKSDETASLYFNAFYGTNELIAAEIIKPSGEVIAVDLDRYVSVSISTSSMDENIFDPNDKIISVVYPGLEVGDVVRLAVRETVNKARVPGFWYDYRPFESTAPLLRYTYIADGPKALPIKTEAIRDRVGDSIRSFKESKGDRNIYRYEVNDVPRLFPEPDMPPIYSVCQRALLSTAEDWQELSRWYWKLCEPHLKPTEEMCAVVDEVLGDTDRKMQYECIWKIFTWVSQNIRYMGITTETVSPGYEPHDVSMTFERRYGVCRDKAALLVAMLRIAGIDAYPVIIHVGEKRDPAVPMTFFNHAIVGVRDKDGSFILMDPTNESSVDLLPSYLSDKSYLAATPEGEPLRTSEVGVSKENMTFIDAKGDIDENNCLTLKARIEFDGINDGAYRNFFANTTYEKRREFIERAVRNAIPSATLKSYEIIPADIQNTDTPLSLELTLEAENYLMQGDMITLTDMPRLGKSFGIANFLVGDIGLNERRFPLELGTPCGIAEETRLSIANLPNEVLALPESYSMSTNGISFSMKTVHVNPLKNGSESGNSVRYSNFNSSTRFEITNETIMPDEYRGFKKALHDIETAKKSRLIFSRRITSEEINADFYYLSKEKILNITSPTSWEATTKTRKVIATYTGVKRASEFMIDYNPIWEEVKVNYAVVSNSLTGAVHELQPEEINIMDAEWVAEAPRYPAGKTMVVSFPGVESGSIIDFSYTKSKKDIPFFSYTHMVQGHDPAAYDRLVVKSHTNFNCEVSVSSTSRTMEFSEDVSDDGIRTITYFQANPETLPREMMTPRADQYLSTLNFHNGSLEEYMAMVDEIVRDASSPRNSRKCAALALKLTRDKESMTGKVQAIRDYVMRNIRLAGPDFTDIPLSATPADVTLADGYGNMLDRAVVFMAMLCDIGLDPEIILAASRPFPLFEDDERYNEYIKVSPSSFTIPLVQVELDGYDNPVVLNDADEYTPLGATRYAYHFAMSHDPEACEEDEEGYQPWFMIDVDDAVINGKVSDRQIELQENGDAIITITNYYSGVDAGAMCRYYSNLTAEELRRHHLELIGEVSASAHAIGELVVNTNSYPHFRAFSLKADSYASKVGNYLTLDIGKPRALYNIPTLKKRVLPIQTPSYNRSFSDTRVVLPDNSSVIAYPDDLAFEALLTSVISYVSDTCLYVDGAGRDVVSVTRMRDSPIPIIYIPEYCEAFKAIDAKVTAEDQHMIVIELKK